MNACDVFTFTFTAACFYILADRCGFFSSPVCPIFAPQDAFRNQPQRSVVLRPHRSRRDERPRRLQPCGFHGKLFLWEKCAMLCIFSFFFSLPLLCFLFQQISDHCRSLGLHTIFVFGFSFLHLCRMRIFEVSRWLRFSVRIILKMTKGEPLAWCGSQSTKYVKMPP